MKKSQPKSAATTLTGVVGMDQKEDSWAEATNGDVLGTLERFGSEGEAVWHYETHRNGCS